MFSEKIGMKLAIYSSQQTSVNQKPVWILLVHEKWVQYKSLKISHLYITKFLDFQ